MHAGEAHVEPGPQLRPAEVADAERVEDPRPQVVGEPFTGQPLQDRGERDHRRLVVGEQRARLGVGRDREEAADGVGRVDRQRLEERLAIVTGRHRGDVADLHPSGQRGSAPSNSSGRWSLTRSSSESRPSPSWSPSAVPVNVLLSEYTRRRGHAVCGAQ